MIVFLLYKGFLHLLPMLVLCCTNVIMSLHLFLNGWFKYVDTRKRKRKNWFYLFVRRFVGVVQRSASENVQQIRRSVSEWICKYRLLRNFAAHQRVESNALSRSHCHSCTHIHAHTYTYTQRIYFYVDNAHIHDIVVYGNSHTNNKQHAAPHRAASHHRDSAQQHQQ